MAGNDFKMQLGGISPDRNTRYVSPGEYVAKCVSAEVEDSNWGNAVRFTFVIQDTMSGGANPDDIGARVDTLMTIPDDTMRSKTQGATGKPKDWAENFWSLMQKKWVSIILASGMKDPGNVDARKIAKKIEGTEMVLVIQDSKRKKPTDPVFSNINGTMSLPPDYKDGTPDTDDEDDSDEIEEFDLDEMDLDVDDSDDDE